MEGEQLRHEVSVLEGMLEQLKSGQLIQVELRQRVLKQEFHRRRLADTTNYKLRALVIKHREAVNAVVKLANAVCAGAADAEHIVLLAHILGEEDSVFVMTMLASRLGRLELDTKAILDRTGLLRTESFVLRPQRETDANLGPVIESVSCARFSINKEHADTALWERFTHDLGPARSRSVRSELVLGEPDEFDASCRV